MLQGKAGNPPCLRATVFAFVSCFAEMAFIPESQREAAILRLPISETLRDMALGIRIPEFLRTRFWPAIIGYGDKDVEQYGPNGLIAIPLVRNDGSFVSVSEKDGQLIFYTLYFEDAEFQLGDPATTEQGFWATAFVFEYEVSGPGTDLSAQANEVGFHYWPLLLERYHAAPQKTYAESKFFLHSLIAEIDALETQKQ